MDTDEETEFFSSDTKQVSGFDMKGRSKSHYGDLGIVYDITERSEAGVEVEYYNNHSNMSSVNNTDMTTADIHSVLPQEPTMKIAFTIISFPKSEKFR